jgi:hypothetical protein
MEVELEPIPQSVAGENGTESPEDVEIPHIDGRVGHPASAGEFSPGKNGLFSVANYASEIQGEWRRGVQAIMEVARLCAEASARLTAAQKSELMAHLPFRRATFSKLAQIGADAHLYVPEIQRLLPPHYTTIYAIALLKDEELKQAIAEKVLHPDLKRDELQRWHRALPRKVGLLPSSPELASDSGDGDDSPAPAPPKAPAPQVGMPPGPTLTLLPNNTTTVADSSAGNAGDPVAEGEVMKAKLEALDTPPTPEPRDTEEAPAPAKPSRQEISHDALSAAQKFWREQIADKISADDWRKYRIFISDEKQCMPPGWRTRMAADGP